LALSEYVLRDSFAIPIPTYISHISGISSAQRRGPVELPAGLAPRNESFPGCQRFFCWADLEVFAKISHSP